jgi:hypothetical protein
MKLKHQLLPKTATEYISEPTALWSDLAPLLDAMSSSTAYNLALRGMSAAEINKTPRKSWMIDGATAEGKKVRKLAGTCGIGLIGDCVYDWPSEDNIRESLERVIPYTACEYISVIIGGGTDNDVIEDTRETLVTDAKVVAYIKVR